MNRSFAASVRAVGTLRAVLLIAVLVLLILVPPPGARAAYAGWPMVTTLLAPVVAPLALMVLLLDALMARVFLTDAENGARKRWKRIILIDLIGAALLLLRWLPYYAALRV